MRIEGRRYADCEEQLDGNEFVDCDFDNVRLVYNGGEPPVFERCRFTSIRIMFDGPAWQTLIFLQAMAQRGSGLEPIFASMFPMVGAGQGGSAG